MRGENIIRKNTLKKCEIIPLSFDYMFTEVFNHEKNINILENLLSIYLMIPIERIKGNVTLLSRPIPIEHKKEANAQVDVLIDFDGDKYNVEMNNKRGRGILKRNIVYASKIHGKEYIHGLKDYNNIRKTVQINFNNFRCNERDVIESYYFKNEVGHVLSESIEIDMIDMVLAKEKCYTDDERKRKIALWCKVLNARTEYELEEAIGKELMDEETKRQLISEVRRLSEDETMYVVYTELTKEEIEYNSIVSEFEEYKRIAETEKEEATARAIEKGLEQVLKRGIEQGIEQGIEYGLFTVARKLKEIGTPISDIVKVTSLSIDQIESL